MNPYRLGVVAGVLLFAASCGAPNNIARNTDPTSPVETTRTVTDYRERLGPYADMVLGTGRVPYGSSEHLTYLVTCIESEGFPVTLDEEEGAIMAKPGVDQMGRYKEVQSDCEQSAISSGLVGAPKPPDEATLSVWYQAYRALNECLMEHGFPVTEPPSETTYVSTGGSWHPYQMLQTSQLAKAEAVCPQDLVTLLEDLASRDGSS